MSAKVQPLLKSSEGVTTEAQAYCLRDLCVIMPSHMDSEKFPGAIWGYGWPNSATIQILENRGWIALVFLRSQPERAALAEQQAGYILSAQDELVAGRWEVAYTVLGHALEYGRQIKQQAYRITRAGRLALTYLVVEQRLKAQKNQQVWMRYGKRFIEGLDDLDLTVGPVAEDFLPTKEVG